MEFTWFEIELWNTVLFLFDHDTETGVVEYAVTFTSFRSTYYSLNLHSHVMVYYHGWSHFTPVCISGGSCIKLYFEVQLENTERRCSFNCIYEVLAFLSCYWEGCPIHVPATATLNPPPITWRWEFWSTNHHMAPTEAILESALLMCCMSKGF